MNEPSPGVSEPTLHSVFQSFDSNGIIDSSSSNNPICSELLPSKFNPIENGASNSSHLCVSFTPLSDTSVELSTLVTTDLLKTYSPSASAVDEDLRAATRDCTSRPSSPACVSSPSPVLRISPFVSSPTSHLKVVPDSPPHSLDEKFPDSCLSVSSGITPVFPITTPSLSQNHDSVSDKDEVSHLQNQLTAMSVRLAATQDQIDRLLEEKRVWIESHPNERAAAQPTTAELRGRWIQAKTMAENYKREKESMVVKYAQSEKKRFQLEQQLRALELQVGQFTKEHSADDPKPPYPFASEQRELQQKLLLTEKDLALAQDQIESLKKSNANSESRIRSLEGRLSQAQENLRSEQKKLAAQNDAVVRLNRSLEAAVKHAKEAERLREREAERLCIEVAYQESQEQLKRLQNDYVQLKEQLNLLDGLRLELLEKDKRLSELTSLTTELSSLRAELDVSKQHELELSEFTRRLTEQNVNLQAENLLSLNRLREAELHLNNRTTQTSEANSQTDQGEVELKLYKEHSEQLDHLQQELIRVRQSEAELRSLLVSEREQAAVRRKRDVDRTRDLIRQLVRCVQRGAQTNDSSTCACGFDSTTACELDSTSSVSVVQSADSSSSPSFRSKPASNVVWEDKLVTDNESHFPSSHHGSFEYPNSSDRRLIHGHSMCTNRLIQTHSQLTEKVEYLEDHCRELTAELNKKTRIIQSLLLHGNHLDTDSSSLGVVADPGGLLTGEGGDDSHHPNNCLHTIQKLQVVLEDVLFKNLTLKSNLNTLGSEVASRNLVIRDFRSKLCAACAAAADTTCEIM